jgi:vacuolar protein 8
VPGGPRTAQSGQRRCVSLYLKCSGCPLTPFAEKYQLEIVKAEGLPALLRLLQSSYLPLILSSAACVRNVSIHPQNESPIIDSGFLHPLINLLAFKDNEEVQCHAISTLRNLAASSEKNKGAIVKAGAVQSIKDLVLEVPMNVQSEMTACIAVLALSGKYLFPIY